MERTTRKTPRAGRTPTSGRAAKAQKCKILPDHVEAIFAMINRPGAVIAPHDFHAVAAWVGSVMSPKQLTSLAWELTRRAYGIESDKRKVLQ